MEMFCGTFRCRSLC